MDNTKKGYSSVVEHLTGDQDVIGSNIPVRCFCSWIDQVFKRTWHQLHISNLFSTRFCMKYKMESLTPHCTVENQPHTQWMQYLREGYTVCVACQPPAMQNHSSSCQGDGQESDRYGVTGRSTGKMSKNWKTSWLHKMLSAFSCAWAVTCDSGKHVHTHTQAWVLEWPQSCLCTGQSGPLTTLLWTWPLHISKMWYWCKCSFRAETCPTYHLPSLYSLQQKMPKINPSC